MLVVHWQGFAIFRFGFRMLQRELQIWGLRASLCKNVRLLFIQWCNESSSFNATRVGAWLCSECLCYVSIVAGPVLHA